jgi:F-type H+-transporting ATPase subunit alpha
MAIDAMIPIGRGQRELIIGDRATGKTTIAIDTIINQARINKANEGKPGFRPLYSIYVGVGPKELEYCPLARGSRKRRAPCLTPLSSAHPLRTARAISILLRSLAQRWVNGSWTTGWMRSSSTTISPSTPSPTGRSHFSLGARPDAKHIPGDVFYLHSRLLERSARVNEKSGNGSLTGLPIIETQAGDVSAYIPTNVISITDGQIYLETDLFYQGVRPAGVRRPFRQPCWLRRAGERE